MAPKRKQAPVSPRRSSRLAKKARVASPEPKVESPEPKIETPEPEVQTPAPPRNATSFVHDDREAGRVIEDVDGTDADDEAEDVQEDDDVSIVDDDEGQIDDDAAEVGQNHIEFPEENSHEDSSESESTDPEDYEVDSDDFHYQMIRERRRKSASQQSLRNDKRLSDIEASPYRLIETLRHRRTPDGSLWKDNRLEDIQGTNRLPNMVRRNGETMYIPLELYLKIFKLLDHTTCVAVSLTNVFNFGLFHNRFGGRRGVFRGKPGLLQYRPVLPFESGIFEQPFPFAPALNMKICLRDILHEWFPKTLTWVDYGDNPMYHGPRSFKIIKKQMKRDQIEGIRVAHKEYDERHRQRREIKEQRQEDRKARIDRRRDRRESRFHRIYDEHLDDPDYSDGHDCIESQCAINYTNAHNTVEYMDSERDSGTHSESSNPPVDGTDDDGNFTDDTEASLYA
ncbi:hypothetical protein NHQ30_002948 [Ciborinia camelliae]|nr:hypothetical protein NHQ30_002948 [Ciborinia camelliae]